MSINVDELDNNELEQVAKANDWSDESDTDTESDIEEDDSGLAEKLRAANEVLKKSAILFEYLSEPDFVTRITKRERTAIDKQINNIYTQVSDIEKTLDSVDDEDDTDEEF